jgi:hypothetical protein
MIAISPAAALLRCLQERLGKSELSDPVVLDAVDAVIGEIASLYKAKVAELEAEITRRNAIDADRRARAQAGAILSDRPELLCHTDLAAWMMLMGMRPEVVRASIMRMVSARPA